MHPESLPLRPTGLGAAAPVPRTAWRAGESAAGERTLAEETPVALVYDGATQAVMMATPADLEDFAIGFSLTEGLIGGLADLRRLEIVEQVDGVEARLWLAPDLGGRLAARRRRLAGPTGCGLCGVDSLAEAVRAPRRVEGALTLGFQQVRAATASLAGSQALGRATRAAHAAGFWRPDVGLVALREDVGRHNALDKLAGALARSGERAAGGAIVLTSRVSVEMVQKAAAMGAPLLIAVSAPTALAVRTAEAAGMTLAAVSREDGFEVFAHPGRITREAGA